LAIWQEPFAAFLHEATGLGAWLKSWFVAPDLASKVARALAVFASEATPTRFAEFMNALFSFVKVSKVRVWMIVDEAPEYDSRFAILWPQAQAVDVFRFVLTGSVGIASFSTKQGLSQWTWDMPVFIPVEVGAFALKLVDALDLDRKVLVDAFGLSTDVDETTVASLLGERLEELFGGVLGLTAECLLGMKKGQTLVEFALKLKGSGKGGVAWAMTKAIKDNGYSSLKALSIDWYNEFNSRENDWAILRDAGLCGSGAPRGVILRFGLGKIGLYLQTARETPCCTSCKTSRTCFPATTLASRATCWNWRPFSNGSEERRYARCCSRWRTARGYQNLLRSSWEAEACPLSGPTATAI
jgi:hypothetical protein